MQWPVNWSLASYEDVGEFFQNSLFKDTASPGTKLSDVMSTSLTLATPGMSLGDARKIFEEVRQFVGTWYAVCQEQPLVLPLTTYQISQVSGVPVVVSDGDRTLVGVLSKKDLSKPGKTIQDVMTTPPIAARPDNKVADAACLMLKHKVCFSAGHGWFRLQLVIMEEHAGLCQIGSRGNAHWMQVHRIPVVDSGAKVVGIVTRTDIFTALASEQGSIDVKVAL